MNHELRALGLAHGLLLGLMLAATFLPDALVMPGVGALFAMTGFRLRLRDRRWGLRRNVAGWLSHVRMAPARLLTWAAAAIAMLIDGRAAMGASVVIAATLCEAIAYPLTTLLIGRVPRPAIAMLMAGLALGGGWAVTLGVVSLTLAFLTGVLGCIFWSRGPDSDPVALATTTTAMGASLIAAFWLPGFGPIGASLATLSGTLALAHLSILRPQPVPWRLIGTAARLRL